jgi:hypothetical protein
MNNERFSVSTWALHTVLGQTYPDTPGDPHKASVAPAGPGTLPLLGIPARVAALGFGRMELCHFQLPSRDPAYLAELRAALADADVELWSLLIDDGDLTHPEHHDRDAAWIAGWLDVAAALGARRARIIAGKQPPSETANALSRTHLRELAARAASLNVRPMTENWFAFLPAPANVLSLLDDLDGALGLCVDWGNWNNNADKYADLAAIFPRGESCHARCNFAPDGIPDAADYSRCLDLARAADFAGPFTLVATTPNAPWEGLTVQRDLLAHYLSR